MIMKKMKQIRHALYIICILMTGIHMMSCEQKSNQTENIEGASLRVTLAFSEEEISNEQQDAPVKSSNVSRTSVTKTLRLGESTQIEYSLQESANSRLPQISSKASTPVGMKAAITRKPLRKGTMYAVLVYDQSGSFVTDRTYRHGRETSTAVLNLDAG